MMVDISTNQLNLWERGFALLERTAAPITTILVVAVFTHYSVMPVVKQGIEESAKDREVNVKFVESMNREAVAVEEFSASVRLLVEGIRQTTEVNKSLMVQAEAAVVEHRSSNKLNEERAKLLQAIVAGQAAEVRLMETVNETLLKVRENLRARDGVVAVDEEFIKDGAEGR